MSNNAHILPNTVFVHRAMMSQRTDELQQRQLQLALEMVWQAGYEAARDDLESGRGPNNPDNPYRGTPVIKPDKTALKQRPRSRQRSKRS